MIDVPSMAEQDEQVNAAFAPLHLDLSNPVHDRYRQVWLDVRQALWDSTPVPASARPPRRRPVHARGFQPERQHHRPHGPSGAAGVGGSTYAGRARPPA
jgi:hypothetical protein